MHSASLRGCFAGLLVLVCSTWASSADPQSFDDLDHPMNTDPDLTIPAPVQAFDEDLAQLWTDALSAKEADLRRRSAETMVVAKRMGMEGLEIAVPHLKQRAADAEEHVAVRIAAVRALVALDAQSEADTVLRTVTELGGDSEAVAAAALARWRYEPARNLWRKRITDAQDGHQALLLAIDGLAAMEDAEPTGQLKEWIADPYTSYDVRLAAARGLASIERAGLETLSSQLLASTPQRRRERLLASALLRNHSGSETEELLEKMALDSEPAVASSALERLIEIAPDRIAKHQAQLLPSRDANVRRWTVQALAKFPTAEHVDVLAQVTLDRHPAIRVLARDTMLDYANNHNLRDDVIRSAEKLLAQEDWRGIEQACRLVGYLDHKPIAPQLVTLLPHKRPEVHTTAAWTLRKLAVAETLPGTLEFASKLSEQVFQVRTSDYDSMFTHMFEFFALMDYHPADPLLRRYVPKLSMSHDSRSAAVWALGYIHKDDPPADLVEALESRLNDVGTVPSESEKVRQYCAVSLGRMKAVAAMESLKSFYEASGSYTGPSYACGWALEQITGEPVDTPIPSVEYVQGWFLSPLE